MKKSAGYVMRKVADEYVLVPHGAKTEETKEVFTLSDTAAFIYEKISEVDTVEELIQEVSSAYQVEKALVENDVREVLKFMEKMGIVESEHSCR